MGKDLDKLFKEIDNLPIYKKDFDVIMEILNNGDPKLFSTIIESILSGELYWSDFEKILSHTDYNRYVVDNLEAQQKMITELSRMSALRDDVYSISIPPKNIALGCDIDNVQAEKEIYNLESKSMRDNIIYELSKLHPEDSDLSILCKIRLYNYIMNYEEGAQNKEQINPDDIFMFINDLLIPIDSRYQVLDSTDLMFMNDNNLSEEEMKKYKSLAFFLRKLEYNSSEVD